MLFNSFAFAIFLPVVLATCGLLRRSLRAQNVALLAASYVFYGWWDVRFLFLIVVSTVIDWCCGIMMERGRMTPAERIRASAFLIVCALGCLGPDWATLQGAPDAERWTESNIGWWTIAIAVVAVIGANALHPVFAAMGEVARRRLFLWISMVANLGILGFFKYFGFFAENFAATWSAIFGSDPGWVTLNVILPVGISFYTFQTMSYTIDIHRRKLASTDRLLEFAAYVAFFPQLVAGPIERAAHLLPQFQKLRPRLDLERFREASWLIAWGLFKKLVIADNLGARVVNPVFAPFDDPAGGAAVAPDGPTVYVAVLAFALQIYGDFSGYTDIARGVAKLFGFDLMLNFNLPYFATSPSDFWRRWHISLSSWLRDYLYIPLGGNRGGPVRTQANLTITMLLGGLWHGAAWNFVIWGAFHGLLLSVYRLFGLRTEEREQPWIVRFGLGVLMFQFTLYGWLLFRARNFDTILAFTGSLFTSFAAGPDVGGYLRLIAYYAWPLVAFQVWQGLSGTLDPLKRAHWFVRLNVWVIVLVSIVALGYQGRQEFIYFAF